MLLDALNSGVALSSDAPRFLINFFFVFFNLLALFLRISLYDQNKIHRNYYRGSSFGLAYRVFNRAQENQKATIRKERVQSIYLTS